MGKHHTDTGILPILVCLHNMTDTGTSSGAWYMTDTGTFRLINTGI
jgi:hypothetical protein